MLWSLRFVLRYQAGAIDIHVEIVQAKKADFDAGKTVSQKQKALNKLRRVQRTVIVLTFMAILAIGFYGFRVFDIDVCCDPDQTYANFGYLIFISVVHVGECITLKQLLKHNKDGRLQEKKAILLHGP